MALEGLIEDMFSVSVIAIRHIHPIHDYSRGTFLNNETKNQKLLYRTYVLC